MLEQLQAVIVSRISSDPLLSGALSNNQKPIPIITELKDDITQAIALAIDSVGICVLVLTPTFEFFNELVYSFGGWALISLTVFENVSANQTVQGTGIRSILLAQRLILLLHHWPHGLFVGDISLEPTGPNIIALRRPLEMTSEGPPLQYTVNFKAHVQLV